jgi:hypothetical protein
MDMKIDLQNFYDVISYKTGSDVGATAVIESVLNHLLIGSVILTSENRDVAYLSLTENGDWKITFVN